MTSMGYRFANENVELMGVLDAQAVICLGCEICCEICCEILSVTNVGREPCSGVRPSVSTGANQLCEENRTPCESFTPDDTGSENRLLL